MPPYLTAIALDAYEADQSRRHELQIRYLHALSDWDRLDMVRIEALAADYDARHPGETPVLDGIEAPSYPAAA